MIARLALPLFLLLPGGCIIYVPDASRGDTRGRIDKEDLKAFEIGGTTREEVLLTLGEPDLVSPDGDVWAYWWYHTRGWILMGAMGSGISGMTGTRIYLCLKFDPESRVVRHKFVHVGENPGIPEKSVLLPGEILSRW